MAGNGEEGNNAAHSAYWNRVNEQRKLHESFMPKNKYGMPIPRAERWGNIMYDEEQTAKQRAKDTKLGEIVEWVKTTYPDTLEIDPSTGNPKRNATTGKVIVLERNPIKAEIFSILRKILSSVDAESLQKIKEVEEWLATSNFGDNDAAIKSQIRNLYLLDQMSKAALHTYNVPNPTQGNFKRNASGKRHRFTTHYWKKINPGDAGYNAGRAAAAPARVNAPAVGDYKKIGNKVLVWTEEPVWLQVDRKTNYNVDLGDTFARYNALGEPYLNARDRLWSIFYPDEEPIRRRAPRAAAAPAAAGPGAAVRRGGAMSRTLPELIADLRADSSRSTLDNVISELEVSENEKLIRLANAAKAALASPLRPGLTEEARLAEVIEMVRYGMSYEAYVVQGLNRPARRNTRRNRRRANRKNRKNTRKY